MSQRLGAGIVCQVVGVFYRGQMCKVVVRRPDRDFTIEEQGWHLRIYITPRPHFSLFRPTHVLIGDLCFKSHATLCFGSLSPPEHVPCDGTGSTQPADISRSCLEESTLGLTPQKHIWAIDTTETACIWHRYCRNNYGRLAPQRQLWEIDTAETALTIDTTGSSMGDWYSRNAYGRLTR